MKRFRKTMLPGELQPHEREVLDLLANLARNFPEKDRVSVDVITAMCGEPKNATLAYLVQHGCLLMGKGDDGRIAYALTAKGVREARRANKTSVVVAR